MPVVHSINQKYDQYYSPHNEEEDFRREAVNDYPRQNSNHGPYLSNQGEFLG